MTLYNYYLNSPPSPSFKPIMSKVQPIKQNSFKSFHRNDGTMNGATSADIDDFEFDEACLFDYDYYDETDSNKKTPSIPETKSKKTQNSNQENLFMEEDSMFSVTSSAFDNVEFDEDDPDFEFNPLSVNNNILQQTDFLANGSQECSLSLEFHKKESNDDSRKNSLFENEEIPQDIYDAMKCLSKDSFYDSRSIFGSLPSRANNKFTKTAHP